MRNYRLTATQLGWGNALLYWCSQLLGALSHERWRVLRYHFVAQPVRPAELAGGRGTALLLQIHHQYASLLAHAPRPEQVLRRRLAQGAYCVSASRAGRLSGFLWLVPQRYLEDEVRACYVLPAPDSVWDFDVWVAPDQRLSPVFARLWQAAHQLLARRGVRWTCSRISAFNPGSLQAHRRLGLQRLGSATFICTGHWQWMLASIPPYWHFSRTPQNLPQFRIDTGTLLAPPVQEAACH